ncbi:hypothetical protein, partial [Plasmodium yoelii yoelii]
YITSFYIHNNLIKTLLVQINYYIHFLYILH